MTQRLDKWISSHTDYSRKEVKALVKKGKVQVDGITAADPGQHLPDTASVVVEGRQLMLAKYLYLMLNKPAGVLSATRDSRQPTVLDLVPEAFWRPDLFPAGRLDKDTEGFVLLTNDGAFAHKVTSPKHRVPKTYRAVLDQSMDWDAVAEEFARGVVIGEGEETSPAQLTLLGTHPQVEVELIIYEGMYHQVKRMFGLFGRQVLFLRRTAIGAVALDPALAPGEIRPLSYKERKQLLT